MTFVFVGEKPSTRALQIGATCHNGRLCAGTLHRALHRAGIQPDEQTFLNLFDGDEEERLSQVRSLSHLTIVALGNRVSRRLSQAGIPHLKLIHPAARGAIRKTENYQAHVTSVLTKGQAQ